MRTSCSEWTLGMGRQSCRRGRPVGQGLRSLWSLSSSLGSQAMGLGPASPNTARWQPGESSGLCPRSRLPKEHPSTGQRVEGVRGRRDPEGAGS